MTRRYLFPYEDVKKDSRLIVYGAGAVGSEMLEQLRTTGYCDVIAVLDKEKSGKFISGFSVKPPHIIAELDASEYDYVLITLLSRMISDEIKGYLISLGVPENKIYTLFAAQEKTESKSLKKNKSLDDGSDVFTLAFEAIGGLGCVLNRLAFLVNLIKTAKCNLLITIVVNNEQTRDIVRIAFPIAVNVIEQQDAKTEDFDFYVGRILYIRKCEFSRDKANRLVPDIVEYLEYQSKSDEAYSEHQSNDTAYLWIWERMLLLGKSYKNLCDPLELIPYKDTFYLSFDTQALKLLEKFALKPHKYIVISTQASALVPCNTKLWPQTYTDSLQSLLKSEFPQYALVTVGAKPEHDTSGVLNLCGRTTIDEVAVLLKYAAVLISHESGLVHVSHFVRGKSIVLFGPTNPKMFGYAENINIRKAPENCSGGCEWLQKYWADKPCLLNKEYTGICMSNITPDIVMGSVRNYLSKIEHYDYIFERTIAFDELKPIIGRQANLAVIGRYGEKKIINYFNEARITIFDQDLSDENANPKCCNAGYIKQMADKGVVAEYGTPYNISAENNVFDTVIGFDCKLPDDKFALLEMTRVTKLNGAIVVVTGENSMNLYRKVLA